MENYLSDEILKFLRDTGKISSQEVALKVGDLLLAEHVIEKTRRVLNCDISSLSESKKLLKG